MHACFIGLGLLPAWLTKPTFVPMSAVTFQAPTSDAWDAPLLLPCPFCIVQARPHAFARSMCEAQMRANLIRAVAPQRHARRLDPRSHRVCPERRIRLRRSCMPTSFGPGCIAFAAQAHAQGRTPLQEHTTLPRTWMPRSGFPGAVGRTACAPAHRSLPCTHIACLHPAA